MNAIILAAGMGTRLRPLTNDIPKCLVPVCGTPMVERQIQFLHEAGITDITLVSGYKADRLNYLADKYGVQIIHNDKFETINNIYSLHVSQDKFCGTWMIEGDIFMTQNCFTTDIHHSTYFSVWRNNYHHEWALLTDETGHLIDIRVQDGSGYIMSGISYWTSEDCEFIKQQLRTIMETEDYTDLFWDHIVLRNHSKMDIQVKGVEGIYEIDTVEELKDIEGI